MYYIYLENGKLNGAGQARQLNEGVENIEVTEEVFNAYIETPEKYIYSDGKIVENPNYEAEQATKEVERINKLTMTALDFIGVLKSFGLTLEQINAYLESNLEVKMQLTYCQNVYCGVVKQLMPITFGDVTITADMVELAFRMKNGKQIRSNSTGEAS